MHLPTLTVQDIATIKACCLLVGFGVLIYLIKTAPPPDHEKDEQDDFLKPKE